MVKTQNLEGNLYLTENWLCKNEMWCAKDNHYYMYPICAKRIFRFKLSRNIYSKFTYSKNHFFKSIIGTFQTNCFYPINLILYEALVNKYTLNQEGEKILTCRGLNPGSRSLDKVLTTAPHRFTAVSRTVFRLVKVKHIGHLQIFL